MKNEARFPHFYGQGGGSGVLLLAVSTSPRTLDTVDTYSESVRMEQLNRHTQTFSYP